MKRQLCWWRFLVGLFAISFNWSLFFSQLQLSPAFQTSNDMRVNDMMLLHVIVISVGVALLANCHRPPYTSYLTKPLNSRFAFPSVAGTGIHRFY